MPPTAEEIEDLQGDDVPYGSASAESVGSIPWFTQSTRLVEVA